MIRKDELNFTSVPRNILANPVEIRGSGTAIQWTWHYCQEHGLWFALRGDTYNRWWGCSQVSGACALCWAISLAKRKGIEWGDGALRFFLDSKSNNNKLERLNARAIREDRRIRVFPVDMGDWCEDLAEYKFNPRHPWHASGHPDVDRMIVERAILLNEMARYDSLDFLTLTKRPQNIERLVSPSGLLDELNNVWIGITTEDQKSFDERWPLIRHLPNILWLSVEPMFSFINLPQDFLDLGGRAWVVIGGESGSGARGFKLEHARHLIAQCKEAGIPVFFKQYGCFPTLDGRLVLSDGHGGNPEHWLEEDRVREWPR